MLGPGQGGVSWSWRGVRNYTPHLFVGRNGRSQEVGFKKQNLVKKLKIKAEQDVRRRRQFLNPKKELQGLCRVSREP